MDASLIGRTVSHYRVIERLGAGGMGVVYRGWDERLERDVALKFLTARARDVTGARERVAREARMLSSLDHPAVATVVAGAMTVQELAEDAAAARFAPLPADLLDEIGRAQRDIGPAL